MLKHQTFILTYQQNVESHVSQSW